MRDFDDVMPLFMTLGAVLTTFARIERRPVDFGLGVTLYPAEVHMLSALDLAGGAGVTGLAASCGVTKGAVSQMVKRLAAKGLVAREPDEPRGRVVLTPLGQAVSRAHFEFHKAHDREFLDYLRGLSEQDYAVCREMCRRMKAWMEAYPE
ncbi:transcriptional regulator, marr family [hydrocarbon metagenome]|uniref:Transcriptional regulator, marr family n=1 Tax=hydrocarbon metagenome TaxID=938273 RepID=A0A0W8GAS1_9ZZZZ